MTKAQEERLVQAFEGISLGLNSIAKCMEERLGKDFPPEKERQDAEVFKQGEQAGAEGAAPGRFENRYSEAQKAASQST